MDHQDKPMHKHKDPVLFFPLDQLEPSPNQTRLHYDREEMELLKASIQRYGILTPLVVQDTGGDRFRVISGHRRLQAALELGLERVPCLLTSQQYLGMADARVITASNQQEALEPFELFWAVLNFTWDYHCKTYDPELTLERWQELLRYILDPRSVQLKDEPDWLRMNYPRVIQELQADLKAFGLPLERMKDRLGRYRAMLPVVQELLKNGTLTWEKARIYNGWIQRARRAYPENPALSDAALKRLGERLGGLSGRKLSEALKKELELLGPRRRTSRVEGVIRRLYRYTARVGHDERQALRERLRQIEQELKEIEARLEG